MPIEQRPWSSGDVANTSVAASCQNRQPAGTRPAQFLTPPGTSSVKQTATGGKDSPSDSVNVCAISRTSNFAEPEFISSPSVFATCSASLPCNCRSGFPQALDVDKHLLFIKQ